MVKVNQSTVNLVEKIFKMALMLLAVNMILQEVDFHVVMP
jgi:small neutral amino acid transporter SnatA (MarC family)